MDVLPPSWHRRRAGGRFPRLADPRRAVEDELDDLDHGEQREAERDAQRAAHLGHQRRHLVRPLLLAQKQLLMARGRPVSAEAGGGVCLVRLLNSQGFFFSRLRRKIC